MRKLLLVLRRLAGRLARSEPPPDPTASFTLRDWADLPVHHPPAEPCR